MFLLCSSKQACPLADRRLLGDLKASLRALAARRRVVSFSNGTHSPSTTRAGKSLIYG